MIWRVHDRSTFVELRRRGSRTRRGPIIVTYLPGTAGDPPRVAYAIGRHVGGAATRNRLRRRARAIACATQAAQPLAPGTYLVSCSPGAADLDFAGLREVLAPALQAAGRGAEDPSR